MKSLFLKKIILENFMCYAHKEIDFAELTKISAMNGVGKSTIGTAYKWVMFNCDYDLKDNPVVRKNGVEDEDVSVTLILDVDGKEVAMRKVQKRKYKKDGISYADDNSYYINDVAKTLKDFNEYLEVDMGLLKMYSNINAFLNQKPSEMREYLFGLVEDVTDLDVAHSKAELAELVPLLEKYTTEELSAMNKATKAKITKDLPVLDGQIKEKERDIQIKQDIDVSDLELLKNSLKEQIESCIAKQTDNDKLLDEYDKASADILDLKFRQSDMIRKANEENIKARKTLELQISNLDYIIDDTKKSIDNAKKVVEFDKDKMAEYQKSLEDSRAEWKTEKEREFDENSLICPYCKQEYSEDKKEELRADFKAHKEAELNRITDKGNTSKKMLDEIKGLLAEAEQELEKRKEYLKTHTENMNILEKQLAELPQEVDVTATEEYKALEQQITEKEQAMHKANDISAVKAELKAQENELRQQLADCEKKIAESNTEKDEQRLEELREQRMSLEQSKADSEKILDLLDELDKAKNEMLSDEINSKFGLVKWQLFEYAKNGNYKLVCVPTVDEKSILTTMSNKGNRILGRIDICRSLQKIGGINCPIWLDDSENLDSENQKKVAEMVDSQLIMLIVNDGKELKVEV